MEFQHVLMDDEQLKESSSISLSCTAPRFVHHILVPRRLAAPPPHRPDLDVTGFRMDSLPKPRPAGISPHSRGGRASIPSALRSTFQLMKPLLSPLEAPASSMTRHASEDLLTPTWHSSPTTCRPCHLRSLHPQHTPIIPYHHTLPAHPTIKFPVPLLTCSHPHAPSGALPSASYPPAPSHILSHLPQPPSPSPTLLLLGRARSRTRDGWNQVHSFGR